MAKLGVRKFDAFLQPWDRVIVNLSKKSENPSLIFFVFEAEDDKKAITQLCFENFESRRKSSSYNIQLCTYSKFKSWRK